MQFAPVLFFNASDHLCGQFSQLGLDVYRLDDENSTETPCSTDEYEHAVRTTVKAYCSSAEYHDSDSIQFKIPYIEESELNRIASKPGLRRVS